MATFSGVDLWHFDEDLGILKQERSGEETDY